MAAEWKVSGRRVQDYFRPRSSAFYAYLASDTVAASDYHGLVFCDLRYGDWFPYWRNVGV